MVYHFLPFLTGERPCDSGETVHTMLGLNDHEMENKHNWVQWCFPNPQPSKTQKKVAQYPMGRNEATLIASRFDSATHVCALLLKVFRFWGIEWTHESTVGLSRFHVADTERFRLKLSGVDHNQKRMTRVITFLFALGWYDVAESLQGLLKNAQDNLHGFRVSAATLGFWTEQNEHTIWEF